MPTQRSTRSKALPRTSSPQSDVIGVDDQAERIAAFVRAQTQNAAAQVALLHTLYKQFAFSNSSLGPSRVAFVERIKRTKAWRSGGTTPISILYKELKIDEVRALEPFKCATIEELVAAHNLQELYRMRKLPIKSAQRIDQALTRLGFTLPQR